MVILQEDFKAHSRVWNLHCGKRKDTAGLQALIENPGLFLNNKLEIATKHIRRKTTSIVDLTFITADVGALDT